MALEETLEEGGESPGRRAGPLDAAAAQRGGVSGAGGGRGAPAGKEALLTPGAKKASLRKSAQKGWTDERRGRYKATMALKAAARAAAGGQVRSQHCLPR